MNNEKGRSPVYFGCIIEGCEKEHWAKQYCKNHYTNYNRCGNPLGIRAAQPKEQTFCECGNEATTRGMCRKHYAAWWYQNRNPATGKRYKDEVGYTAMHSRIRGMRGHPREYPCAVCGEENATQWALSAEATELKFEAYHSDRPTQSAYSLNVYDYLPMHEACHKAYDAEHKNRNYKAQQARWEETA